MVDGNHGAHGIITFVQTILITFSIEQMWRHLCTAGTRHTHINTHSQADRHKHTYDTHEDENGIEDEFVLS